MRRLAFAGVLLLAPPAAASDFVNFESPQTAPARLSPDGSRLFVANTADGRVSVFDLTEPALPVLVAEIPVGVDPVSVAPRTNDEVWVVNHVSDSIQLASVDARAVVATIPVGNEPADVVFAGDPEHAFVSVSGDGTLAVVDVATRAVVAEHELAGAHPRALAARPDGLAVYVAYALSGNRTVALDKALAPLQPVPTNPNLPPAPKVARIVDHQDPQYAAAFGYALPDHDVTEVDAQTLQTLRHFDGVGTVNLGLAVRPGTGDLYVTNTDARNLVRFVTALRGHPVDNRLTRVTVGAQPVVTPFDLNPGLDYSLLPNPAAQATALAQPAAVVFDPSGAHAWVAAFGTDRVAKVDPGGAVLARVDLGSTGPIDMRGPRGLALRDDVGLLYVSNRVSNTVSVVDTAALAVVGELPIGSFDPTPAAVAEGRGFLYDARLSGNGTLSCASCHVDGGADRLAWDLGDPGGVLVDVQDPQSGTVFTLHPMKGPMVTRTMKGLSGFEPFNWRGDRADFAAFNEGFDALLGGTALSPPDLARFEAFFETLTLPSNPNLEPDGALPALLNGVSPATGLQSFVNNGCTSCHGLPGHVFPKITIENASVGPMKTPDFRSFHRKISFSTAAGAVNELGFGSFHDGAKGLSTPTGAFGPIVAFQLCFDTGTPPAVGRAVTVDAGNAAAPDVAAEVALLGGEALLGRCDVVLKGTIDGAPRGLLYDPAAATWTADAAGVGPFTHADLLAKALAGDAFTILAVPAGSGTRLAIDRDRDGTLDGDEAGPSWTPYGTPCGGAGGPPLLSGIGVPAPGQNVALELSNGPPAAPALVLGGTGTGSLPIDPWCDLQILPLAGGFLVGAALPPSGALRLTAPIPAATPTPLEATFQALVADPTAPGGLGVTAPTRLRIE